MNMKIKWAEIQREEDARYVACLDTIDPSRSGVGIICPACFTRSWIKLPTQRQGNVVPLQIACPKACGYFGKVESFSPAPLSGEQLSEFDIEQLCSRDGTIIKSFGKLLRCPFCAYENPREIMADLLQSVEDAIRGGEADREKLADLLSRVGSTFDGTMRVCNAIAVRNFASDPRYEIAPINSFQNLRAARDKMLPHWDMAATAGDWSKFILAFQKRHCFAHSLGVVDQVYLDKTGDKSVRVGQNVKLEPLEVLQCAIEAKNIVNRFFGYYLS